MMAIGALVRRILINISDLAQGNESSQVYFKFPRIFQIRQIPRFSIEKLKSTDDANGDDLILGGSGKVRVWNVKSNISRASQA